ncbi:MAG: TRAP transporter small permease [Acidiferrobacterales bacterium]
MARESPAEANANGLAEQVGEASRRQELSNPDDGLPRIDRIINRIVEVMGVAVLCTIVGTIFINAFGRYAFNFHIIWAEELVLLLVPWLAMTGVFLAVRRGTMIRIEFFFDKLPPSVRRPVAILGYILCIATLIFMAWTSAEYVSLFGGDRTPYLAMPKGVSTVALVIGGVAAAIAFLVTLLRERKRQDTDPYDGVDDGQQNTERANKALISDPPHGTTERKPKP